MESQRTMGASAGPNSSDTLHIQLVIYKRLRARKSCRISAWGSDTIGRNRLRSDGKGEGEVSGQTDGLVRFHGSHGHILTEKKGEPWPWKEKRAFVQSHAYNSCYRRRFRWGRSQGHVRRNMEISNCDSDTRVFGRQVEKETKGPPKTRNPDSYGDRPNFVR